MDSETDLKGLLKVKDSIWVGQVNLGVDSTQLGVGSDAIVYRTLHDGQNVAAKGLHPILISPGNPGRQAFLERFGEECLRLRQLSYPSVVSFIGVGQAPNKCPCLLTELMEESLASRINATPPDPFFQTLSYLIDMSAGLRYLYRLSLIHRDLKPYYSRLCKNSRCRARVHASWRRARYPGPVSWNANVHGSRNPR